MTKLERLLLARADEQMVSVTRENFSGIGSGAKLAHSSQACRIDGCQGRVAMWSKSRLCLKHNRTTERRRLVIASPRNDRIRHAAAENPTLPLFALAERFDLTPDTMREILGRDDCARRANAQLNERECRRARGPDSPQFNPWRKTKGAPK